MLQSFRTVILLIFSMPLAAQAKPVSAEIYQQQKEAFAKLESDLTRQTTDSARYDLLSKAFRDQTDPDWRRQILELAEKTGGAGLEAFVTSVAQNDPDAHIRALAATILGRSGSEKSIPILVKLAASDQPTQAQMGCIVIHATARRQAMFALSELGQRFPNTTQQIITALRDLRDLPADNESLPDVRLQSLYQLTWDESLLKSFYDRLASNNPAERASGVIAFRFLKLRKAPPRLVEMLKDNDPDVRTWAALVLGEISDARTVKPLMEAAADRMLDKTTRVNAIHSLGQMTATSAAKLMENLTSDPDEAIATQAAIALYRITGKKTAKYPAGWPD